jgi:hypothetical protein
MNIAVTENGSARRRLRLPIVAHHAADVSLEEQSRIAELARQVRAENPRLCCIPQLADNLDTGLLDAPALLIEDHSGIQLAHERGADTNLSYRALLLAEEGDLLAVYGDRHLAFEKYCRDRLGLGRVEIIAPPLANPGQSLANACLADGRLIEWAVQRAQQSGGLNIIPYMATGNVWRLAGEIANRVEVPIRLAGPPPVLMRTVNDKLWFARWAAKLLGPDAVPHSRAVYGMAALVGYLRRFMRQYGRVAIKLSHSAASLGNLVLDSADFVGLSVSDVSSRLQKMIDLSGWQNLFPLQVTAWEAPLLATPSAQLWIPYPQDGPPIIEGVFDQITVNTNARFAGAVPSNLPDSVQARVVDGAFRLGLLFQTLGYFGRCSFDAVLVDDGGTAPPLHWVECNGRWGGVSIPMTLSNRLLGDWKSRDMLIIEQQIDGIQGLTVAQFLSSCESELLAAGGNGLGAVLLSPGRLSHGAYDLLILGSDRDDVLARSKRCTELLGHNTRQPANR